MVIPFPRWLRYSPLPLAIVLAVSVVELMPAGRVIDGDTIVVWGERIRLNGINAPEMPGHVCHRYCADGDPFAAKVSLERLLHGRAQIERLKRDRYGRTVAEVTVKGVDLSCAQLRAGHAIYAADWDERRTLQRSCGDAE